MSEQPALSSARALRTLLDSASVAMLTLDARGRVTACNGLAERLLRTTLADRLGTLGSAGQEVQFIRLMRRLLSGQPVAAELTTTLGDGARLIVSWRGDPLRDESGVVVGAVVVAEEARARREARQDAAVVDALFRQAPVGLCVFDTVGRISRVNRRMAEVSGQPAGAHRGRSLIDMVPNGGDVLAELVDHVLRTGEPVIDTQVVGIDGRLWLASIFRLDHAGHPVGAGCVVHEVTGQRRAELARRAAARRLAFLAEAGTSLSGSLDPDAVVSTLCHLLVPDFADHAVIDLRDDSGAFRRRAAVHAEGIEIEARNVRPQGRTAAYDPAHPIQRAVDTAEVQFCLDVAAEPGFFPPGDDTRFMRDMSVRSAVIVPLVVAGRVIGVLTVLHSVSRRQHTRDDVDVIQDLAGRAASAVFNALSFEQQRTAALALQRSLLPQLVEAVDSVNVSWRYVPGAEGTEVGGDWVDVFALPDGRVAIVVGDVMGRGLHAAAVMGQLRTAVRVLAPESQSPADLMTRLSALVVGLPGEELATCIVALFDPGRSRLVLSNAGHLPPLLSDGAGRPLPLMRTVGVPLGVSADWTYEDFEIAFPLGTGMALYTDGLVESATQDIDTGIDLVAQSLSGPWDDLEALAERALDAGVRHAEGFGDDVAVLLVRAEAPSPDAVVNAVLPSKPSAVAPSRALLGWALDLWGLDREDLRFPAELMLSEVVTNALRYAPVGIEVLIRRASNALYVEVVDADARLPRLRTAAADDEGGRGLALVQALSSAWGARPLPTGKVVWFKLELAED